MCPKNHENFKNRKLRVQFDSILNLKLLALLKRIYRHSIRDRKKKRTSYKNFPTQLITKKLLKVVA